MSPRGAHQTAAMNERLDRYAALRDAGADDATVKSELGISETTRGRYERWYRRARVMPPRSPDSLRWGER